LPLLILHRLSFLAPATLELSGPWYSLALRREAERAERAAARRVPRKSPRPGGGPTRSLLSWTGLPPFRRRRPATHLLSPTYNSPEPSSPGSKVGPTRSNGRRRPPPGSGWRTAWQPARAPGWAGGRWAGGTGGRLGAAVPAQLRRLFLAARGGGGAAHRSAPRAPGAARLGDPARPRRPQEPSQPGPLGDRPRRGVRDQGRLQLDSSGGCGMAATPSPRPCAPYRSRLTGPPRS
jgi:hypothetical protein